MPFHEYRKRTMPDEIVKEFLLMIQKGELKPGDQLPSELELMERMGISRSSLREALKALSIMNIISVSPGRRTTVTSLAPELLMENLEFVISREDDTLLHLFDTRKLIEVGCASMAAERITDEEIIKLNEIIQKDDFYDMDIELHQLIVEITKNPITKRVYDGIARLGQMSRKRTANLAGVREQSQIDHALIVKAITSRNPEAARAAMLKHLTFVEDRLREDIAAAERSKKSGAAAVNLRSNLAPTTAD